MTTGWEATVGVVVLLWKFFPLVGAFYIAVEAGVDVAQQNISNDHQVWVGDLES